MKDVKTIATELFEFGRLCLTREEIEEKLRKDPQTFVEMLRNCIYSKATDEETRKTVRELLRKVQKARGYITVEELMSFAVKKAKANPMWSDDDLKIVDYMHICSWEEQTQLRECEFDVVCNVAYGGSEGIYADIQANGNWGHPGKNLENRAVLPLYTIKTLETDINAWMTLAKLGNLIAYYAIEVVAENIDRFD